MSLVAAADYEVRFRDPDVLPENYANAWDSFCGQDAILITKKTKKGERELDLKPLMYQASLGQDADGAPVIFLRLSPEAPTTSSQSWCWRPSGLTQASPCRIRPSDSQKELYANSGTAEEPHFVSLEALGEEF